MNFLKYPKVRKLGDVETEGIEVGECVIFPKVDGTNSQLWWDDGLKAGSRNRELTLENDNAGFYAWALKQPNLVWCLTENPDLHLYGEYLVPHTLRTYRKEAWETFYVFDVMRNNQFLHYNEYKPILEKYEIEYIPPLGIIKNGGRENFEHYLDKNHYLIEDGKGSGEGICIKNYDFINRFGRVQWAKIVRNEFKEKNHKEMGPPTKEFKRVESEIAESYTTKARIEKIYNNIATEQAGWKSEYIPRLLNTVYYDIIIEDIWNILKENNHPTINFTNLKQQIIVKIKQQKPEIF